jgi:hypothetical protein
VRLRFASKRSKPGRVLGFGVTATG